jgi:hypothetical protein
MFIFTSLCDANHIEETEDSLGQDKVLNGASSNSSLSSSHGSHICLMARSSNHSDVEDIVMLRTKARMRIMKRNIVIL